MKLPFLISALLAEAALSASCSSCCAPKPIAGMDCESYTPAFFDLQCNWGGFIDGEFLYWYARESNLSYALKVTGRRPSDGSSSIVLAPSSYENLSTKWDPGFRIGIGWNSLCDGWDLYLNWTSVWNRQKKTASVPPYSNGINIFFPNPGQKMLVNPWINPALQMPNSLSSFDKISAEWRLRFNQIDLELARKYWLSRCFNLRFYAGVRGAWTETQFNLTSERNAAIPGTTSISLNTFKDDFTNCFWGIGFLTGLQPTWYLCSGFALFGKIDASLIWGQCEAQKRENTFVESITGMGTLIDVDFQNTSKNTFFMMQAVLDLSIGFRWEEKWCCDRYRTTLDLGWEHHIWFNHNPRQKTEHFLSSGGYTGFSTYDETVGNLMLGGFVLSLRMDF